MSYVGIFIYITYKVMSMTQPVGDSNIMYLMVIWGKMVQKSEEGVEGAKKREYEDSKGVAGVKWEIAHRDLTGSIKSIDFKDTQFGEQCIITLVKGTDTVKLTMGTGSRYFVDFAKKLPNIDLYCEVELNSFDFTAKDTGKQVRWLSIKQDGQKVTDYYYDGKENINGIPSISKEDFKGMTKKKWQVFFIWVEEFLIWEVKKVEVPEYVAKETTEEETKEPTVNKDEEISVEDIPF